MGAEQVKECCRLIREARKRWDAHENQACRRERERALIVYEGLTKSERNEVPEQLRIWLRYRSEKYFGKERRGNGMSSRPRKEKKKDRVPEHSVAHRKIQSPVGPLYLLSSRKGICGVYFGHRIEVTSLPKENPRDRFLDQATRELEGYFQERRQKFEVAIDPKGTAFCRAVWRQLSEIPFGVTRTYGDLANALEQPGAVRAVGTANGANPISIIVPCHRVIGKDGSLIGFGGGLEIKEKLLRHEKVLL